ncbi:mucin-21 [Eurosta solidaginis]|uniref:mucin-21 n=1 Tax=Eurosta solidaginis TaxID=178769 RepID=UPI003531798C
MPIQLDKILADIAKEKSLHPNYPPASKREVDEAWARVGKNNKLSVHEARSIFKVLQKKYEQEKTKRTPSWKLFDLLEKIHQPMKDEETKPEDDGMLSMEEDEEYEMLEVQEEEESTPVQAKAATATSDGESPTKSMKSAGSTDTSPEKEEKPLVKTQAKANSAAAISASSSKTVSPAAEEKKLLNSVAASRPSANSTPMATAASHAVTVSASATNAATAATAAALHKKGITMKKASASTGVGAASSSTTRPGQATSSSNAQTQSSSGIRVGGTIQMPESIKRKLVETQPVGPQPAKKSNTGQSLPAQSKAVTPGPGTATQTTARNTTNASSAATKPTLHESALTTNDSSSGTLKEEPNESSGINLITIPANSRVELTNGVGEGGPSSSTAATVASTSTNGYSPRLEDVDFRNDIIFDTGNGPINGTVTGVVNNPNHANATGGIINLGNFDNSLPPTFFKNLCNSSRHEALGLYVANVMNRLRARSAARLELGILRAIIDVQSDELEQ